ncbi:Neprilysin 2 [Carabus blaptoides fortunei]
MKTDWILLLVVCSVLHVIQSANSTVLPFFLKLDVCETKSCQTDAIQLLQSLNQSVNPCEDFYQFACGGWLARNQRPASQSVWSQWEPVMETVQERLHDILAHTRKPTHVKSLVMARAMYDACIHIDQHEQENTLELMKVIDKYGGWPMVSKDWSDTHVFHVQVGKINADFNIFPLVKCHVSPNLYNTSQYVLYIDRPELIYPHYMLTSPRSYKAQIKSYIQWIVSSAVEIAGANQLKLSLRQVKQDALELVDFEIELAGLADTTQDTHHNITTLYKQMSVEQLQLWTDLVSAKNHSLIIWTDMIHILTETNKGVDTVVVQDLVYLLKLIQLVTRTSNRTIANYLAWNIVKYFAKDVSASLEQHSFVIDKLLYGVDDKISRQTYCITTVTKRMQLAISHAYIEKHLNEPMKNDIEMLMNNIKNVLAKKLSSLQWLDSDTRQKALEKAKAIRYLAAYPEYLQNSTYIDQYYSALNVSDNSHIANIRAWNVFIRRKEFRKLHSPDEHSYERWFSSVTDVNAYYSVLHNAVILPGALLQHPFYSMKRLKALNYGAIGTIIGHEFSHAFDNTGRQADKDGNIKQWWSTNSLANYVNHLRCLESHYSKYMIHIKYSQDENIADIVGLNLAFAAYTQVKHRDVKVKLPGLERYTPDQLFFISFANQWCEVITREQLQTQLLDGEHTPSQVRIMGAVSSSVAFSKAFHCPATARMNPKHKCPLW